MVDPSLILELLLECELEGVTRLRCCEGMLPLWDASLFAKLEGLRILNLSSCQLTALPTGMSNPQHALVNLPHNCSNLAFLDSSSRQLSGMPRDVPKAQQIFHLATKDHLDHAWFGVHFPGCSG